MPPLEAFDQFCAKLKEHIQRKGVPKTWLAQQLGYDRGTIYRYLDGTSRMSVETLQKLIPLIGLNAEEARELRILGGYEIVESVHVDLRPTLEAYLKWLETTYGSTQPLGIATEQVQLSLETVHVPLRVVDWEVIEAHHRRMRGEEGEISADAGAGLEQSSRRVFTPLSEPSLLAVGSDQLRRQGGSVYVSADNSLPSGTTRCLLLLGDAGSGKSLTLRYAALRFADAYRRGEASRLADPVTGLDLQLRKPPIPIYIRLTLFAATIPTDLHELPLQERQHYTGAPPDLFLSWLDRETAKYCELREGVLLSSLVKRNDGQVILLLDGLDEAGDDLRRAYLAELITNLARRYANQRYVVASRTAGYRGNVYLPNFLACHLSPLETSEAQLLLKRWFEAVYARLATIGRRQQERSADQVLQLWGAIEQQERLATMATNPLLLTVMALLQFNQVRLPDQRARLYEKLIELLLELWRKQNVANDTLVMSGGQLSSERRRLEALALAMQQQLQQVREVTLSRAQEWLSPLYIHRLQIDREAADERVADLLHRLSVDSGIIQRRDERYSFTHYTFQEYLAARALDSLDTQPGTADSVTFLLERSRDPRWRETLLLAAGSWSMGQQFAKTERLLEGLLERRDRESLLLAADALVDIGLVDELTLLRGETTTRLRRLAALNDEWRTAAHPDPVVRNRAAMMLDRLDADSDRPGLDLTKATYWANRIEPGIFSMGDDQSPYTDQQPPFDCMIQRPYALARFPVTNRHYVRFMEALAGRGTPEAVTAAAELRLSMVEYGQTLEQFRPRFWPGTRYRDGEGSHPVVGVSWYAATAFARWADTWLRTMGLLAPGEEVRLPTEAEWERAAAYPILLPDSGTRVGRRVYPWGDGATARIGDSMLESIQANSVESQIRSTSVVGIFPQGAAACGAEEMGGNVWEWCCTPGLHVPFTSSIQSERQGETHASLSRYTDQTYVLRGGSWRSELNTIRCTYRSDLKSEINSEHGGFRLAFGVSVAID